MALKNSKFGRLITKVNRLPRSWRPFLLTRMFCSHVKYAATSKVKIDEISEHQVKMSIANRKRVQNHIGSVHAVAVGLLAESASGIATGVHLTDDKLPLIQTMKIDYTRRVQGDLKAVASISDEQIALMQSEAKGSTIIPVTITDESGEEPVQCEMLWAWVTKKPKATSEK